MKTSNILFLALCCIACKTFSQDILVKSPNNAIAFSLQNNDALNYAVVFNKNEIIKPSKLGFQFNN